jgi:hypothetical protein
MAQLVDMCISWGSRSKVNQTRKSPSSFNGIHCLHIRLAQWSLFRDGQLFHVWNEKKERCFECIPVPW